MKYVEVSQFGGPEVLKIVDKETPTVADGMLVVEVKAAGVNYADVAAQMANAIKPPSSQFLGNPNGTKISDNLVNGNMTCATCHEVHNKDNVADANNTYNYFLYAPESGSQICLSCHIK